MRNFANFDARFTFVSEIFRLLQKSEKPLLSEAGLNGFELIMDDLLALNEARRHSRQDFSDSLWSLPPASGRIN